jgi:agarase
MVGIRPRLLLLSFCAAVLITVSTPAQDDLPLDRFGGWQADTVAATGSFRVLRSGQRWWFITPDGHKFLSAGVINVSYAPDIARDTRRSPYREAVAAKFDRQSAWTEAVVERLRDWGFNTIGAGSDRAVRNRRMPYTVALDLTKQARRQEGQAFPDVFAPVFERSVRHAVRRLCIPLAADPWLIGYFTDAELRWDPDSPNPHTLFADFLRLDTHSSGRRALINFLKQRYLAIAQLNEEWDADYDSFDQVGRVAQGGADIPQADEDDFLRLVADRYFTVTENAIRAADRNHLILGCQFAGSVPRPVLEAMADHVDVVSISHYDELPPEALLREIHRATGRPILISSFTFRARDSDLPNTKGSGVLVDTQEERARYFERYVRELLGHPAVVGCHWLQHADQPAAGRLDGENSNYGLVNIEDEPYQPLVEAATRVNRSLYLSGAKARE